jgi:hypothetical protein
VNLRGFDTVPVTVPTSRRRRFLRAQTAWLLVAALVLALLDSLSYELFFVVAFAGFLVVTELTDPVHLTPRWRRRVRWVLPPALLVVGYLVLRRVVSLLPPELVPPLLRDALLVRLLALGPGSVI